MEIRITAKGMPATEDIKEWIFRKVSKLEKFFPRIVEAHAFLKKEKYFYVAEITLLAKHHRIFGEAQDKNNLFTAIDLACDRVATQVKKYREKIKSHSAGPTGPTEEPSE